MNQSTVKWSVGGLVLATLIAVALLLLPVSEPELAADETNSEAEVPADTQVAAAQEGEAQPEEAAKEPLEWDRPRFEERQTERDETSDKQTNAAPHAQPSRGFAEADTMVDETRGRVKYAIYFVGMVEMRAYCDPWPEGRSPTSLMTTLQDRSAGILERALAARLLGLMQHSEALEPLLAVMAAPLGPDQPLGDYRCLRDAVIHALGDLGDRRAVPTLVRALDEDEGGRFCAVTAYLYTGGLQWPVPPRAPWRRFLPLSPEQPAAGTSVGSNIIPRSPAFSLELGALPVGMAVSNIAAAAAESLAEMGADESVPALIKVLQEDTRNGTVRCAVAGALGQIGGPDALLALRTIHESPAVAGSIRREAHEAIVQIESRGKSRGALLADLENEDPAVVCFAIHRLVEHQDESAIPALKGLFGDFREFRYPGRPAAEYSIDYLAREAVRELSEGREAAKEPLEWDRPRFEERQTERDEMVRTQIKRRGVEDEEALAAMLNVPRHRFMPGRSSRLAYADQPVPIGKGQTISQPFIVAYMTELLDVEPGDRVLEIGTGSGYQAAVLSELTPYVFTIEIIETLAKQAKDRLKELGYKTIKAKQGDGYYGWEEHAPFDGIIVTAAAGHVPLPLVRQLKPGGKMVIPVGGVYETQHLVVISKDEEGKIKTRSVLPVRFVPMTGRVQDGG